MFGTPKGPSPAHDSQVMSAIIKHVRLRRPDDAIYWLTHYIHFWPKEKFRLTRRILIMAGEDCLDPPVQQAVAEWVFKAFSEQDEMKWYRGAVAMIHLICATDDWWKSTSGSRYIASFLEGEKWIKSSSDYDKSKLVSSQMDFKIPNTTMVQHMLRHQEWTEPKEKTEYAKFLADSARDRGNLAARIPASIHFRFGKALAKDDNYIGQTVYRLAFGNLGKNVYPTVNPEIVKTSVDTALLRLKNPEKTPKYVQDGIHCYGKDRRFAGVLESMVGCCIAYRVFGRLDPKDDWDQNTLTKGKDEKDLLQLIAAEEKNSGH